MFFFRRLRRLELCGQRHVRLRANGNEVWKEEPGAVSVRRYVLHRHAVGEGQLTLAFQDVEVPPPEALYCLLPVKHLGFHVALDGPFELVASRGDVHEGSARNQVLVEALPEAFAGALRAHPQLAPRALSYLGQVTSPLWRPAHQRLLEELRGTACVQLEDGGHGLPEHCLLRPQGLGLMASQLIQSELLWRSCQRRWAKASSLGLEAG